MGSGCRDPEHFVECVRRMRHELPHTVIIAGNVVTGEMTEELILAAGGPPRPSDRPYSRNTWTMNVTVTVLLDGVVMPA